MTPRNTDAKKRRFDCVEMMHRGAVFVRKELEGKTIEEQIAYPFTIQGSTSFPRRRESSMRDSPALLQTGFPPSRE